ncbi:MAG: hypothetical protein ABIR32_01790, partial [Ilumatobacteraceae bacterium]
YHDAATRSRRRTAAPRPGPDRADTGVWGRDDLDAGEMWNSNSVTSWILFRAGVDTTVLAPPNGGRAPGWNAVLVVAARTAHAE